jgi:DNA ligase D-like protein (predicted ligase)
MYSRTRKQQTALFPEVVSELTDSLRLPAILDGEVVCLDAKGRSSFSALQQRFNLQDIRAVRARMIENPAFLYVFDVIYLDRHLLTSVPLKERKGLLTDVVEWSERIRCIEFRREKGTALWRKACQHGEEGIIAKRLDSPYVSHRSSWWLKIKCLARQEFVIGGFTDPQGSRAGFGALLMGYFDADGRTLRYAGKVGTGFSDRLLRVMLGPLKALEQPHCPFAAGELPHRRGVHFVKPALVAEVAFGEWTHHGHLRQPRFEGLRPDKNAQDVRREVPAHLVK